MTRLHGLEADLPDQNANTAAQSLGTSAGSVRHGLPNSGHSVADADAAGRLGVEGLSRAAKVLGVLPLVLYPELGDFNEDRRRLAAFRIAANLRRQLIPDDAATSFPIASLARERRSGEALR